MTVCRECGAVSCESRFHEFLAMEYVYPEFAAVHHLTVATYMLQHSSRLSRKGWLFERQLLAEFLEQSGCPARIRRDHSNDLDSRSRGFKFKSLDGEPLLGKVRWGRTIRDIRPEPADAYREDVTAWAHQTLVDSRQVVLETHGS